MFKDRVKGAIKRAKGSVKEATGKVTRNGTLEASGKMEKTGGKIHSELGKI